MTKVIDDIKIQTDYLGARLDALEQVLCVTIATLSEQQKEFIVNIAEQYAEKLADHANAINTEMAHERAVAASEIAEQIIKAIDHWDSK